MNEPLIRSNRSIGWLRFLAWIMPSCIVPVLWIVPRLLSGRIPFFIPDLTWPLSLGALIYLARFDALLQCQQRKIPHDDPRARIGKRMTTFVLLQLLVIPVVWLALAYSFCAITGTGFR